MKKILSAKKLIGGTVLSGVLAFSAFSGFAASTPPKVEVNGVSVYSPASYSDKGRTWVDVNAFFDVMNKKYTYNKKTSTITYGKKSIKVKTNKGELVAGVHSLSDLIGATKVTTKKDGSTYILILPKGTIKITDSIPAMGEHWTNPSEDILVYGGTEGAVDDNGAPIPVFKTIYGVYEGELVFIEQMIAQEYMEGPNAKSWKNIDGMKGLPSPSVVQSDIEFQPAGHEGYTVPHYDFHHYYISDEEQQAIHGQPHH